MSIRLMTLVWDVRFPTQSQLLIALKLADFANDAGGSVYPSRSRLADDAQCSESTVKSTLRFFREIGLLHVIKEGGHGPRDTTEYMLNIRLLSHLAAGDCAIGPTESGVEIKWANKGAEFDPLDDVRGQNEQLRGQNKGAKGSTALPPIHQETPNRTTSANARPCDEIARASFAEEPKLLMPGDHGWQQWLTWADDRGCRQQFEAEGAIVVFSTFPGPGAKPPTLPPLKTSPTWTKLALARAERRFPKGKMAAVGSDA